MGIKKQAKFFCENCNTEVKQHAKFCPKCGKFFASVKCPNCGKIGASSEFSKGCPRCGYALPPKTGIEGQSPRNLFNTMPIKRQEDALPPWIYLISILLLAGILLLLITIL